MGEHSYDIVIIGGGVMGSAAAYYLTRADERLRVAVIERDPTYARASTTLSMANARIQFSLRKNVEISMYALEVLENFETEMAVEDRKPAISYRREGNLFMVDADGRDDAEAALAMQQSLGCRIEWWTPEETRQRYPLYDTNGYVGGTFGPHDGHFDAYAFLMGYRAKARSQGAVFMEGEGSEIITQHGAVAGVRLQSGDVLRAGVVINCAGAWCAEIAATAGIELPVQPTNRQVFALDTAVKPETPLPLTVLPSGLYFRTETGGLILLGKSMPDDAVGFDFRWDDKRFMDELWLELATFVPSFDRLKLVRGWGGLYAVNTLDGNAIVGQWPSVKGLYLANGFSGHGLQQAPAVGRYLTELILGRPHVLDLSIFDPQRIMEKRPLTEKGLV